MARHGPSKRRTVLRLCVVAAAGAAGCATTDGGGGSDQTDDATGDGGANESETDTSSGAGTDATAETTADADTGTTTAETTPDLDLREANVTAVEFEQSDGQYRFSVTLYHDDDGEEGYADWWQVDSLDGEQLGRRDLAHPHSTDPFTRSETIEVPEGVSCVVVRGHDQTHEYGGRAMLVNLDSGATRAVTQGAEPQSFGEGDCP